MSGSRLDAAALLVQDPSMDLGIDGKVTLVILRSECGPFNVLVNTVCPGYTLTERLVGLAGIRAGNAGTTTEEILKTMTQSTR